jgi:hypothetical protein
LFYRTPLEAPALSQETILKIENGDLKLYVMALISYLDITETPRKTQLCFFYHRWENKLWAHNKYNEMT